MEAIQKIFDGDEQPMGQSNIRAYKRILYKDGNNWLVGLIAKGNAEINEQGIWVPIIPIQFAEMMPDEIPYIQYSEINQIFTNCEKLEDWIKDYSEYFMTKQQYADFVEKEDFNKALETAYVSDGEYYYYPISRYTRAWIEKQPFDYVMRSTI